MIGLHVDISSAFGWFTRARDRVSNPRLLLASLEPDLQQWERGVFRTRNYGRWAPLDPATVKAKGHGRVLVDTGDLLAELTRTSSMKLRGETLTLSTRHVGAAMAARGANGAPKRVAVPVPSNSEVGRWAGGLLSAITGRR